MGDDTNEYVDDEHSIPGAGRSHANAPSYSEDYI